MACVSSNEVPKNINVFDGASTYTNDITITITIPITKIRNIGLSGLFRVLIGSLTNTKNNGIYCETGLLLDQIHLVSCYSSQRQIKTYSG